MWRGKRGGEARKPYMAEIDALLAVVRKSGSRTHKHIREVLDNLEESYPEELLIFLTESRRALAFATGVGPPDRRRPRRQTA